MISVPVFLLLFLVGPDYELPEFPGQKFSAKLFFGGIFGAGGGRTAVPDDKFAVSWWIFYHPGAADDNHLFGLSSGVLISRPVHRCFFSPLHALFILPFQGTTFFVERSVNTCVYIYVRKHA